MNQREFLIISITVFLTVIGWIIADLHHVSQTKKVLEVNEKFSKPINITINKEIFSVLERRR